LSLILDALRKLERERGAGDPGVVVLGSVPWGEGGRARRRASFALGAVLALSIVALGMWWLLRPSHAGPSSPPAPAAAANEPAAEPASPARGAPSDAADQPSRDESAPSASPLPVEEGAAAAAAPAGARPFPSSAAGPGAHPGAVAAGPSQPATPPGAATRDSEPAMPDLHLSAISVRDGTPIALVNDRLVREGDSFDGVRIVRIGEAEVEVEFRGARHVLRF